jgi:hypothetical protein
MAQFIAFDPKVEAIGQAVMASLAGMGEAAKPFLKAHGLDDIQLAQWYLQQNWLDFLKDLADKKINAMPDMVSIGLKIPENALFPPEINSIPTALTALDVAYHMNHRNGEIGHYRAEVIGDSAIDMVCENPYPCDFDYGIIYGMVRRFRPTGVPFTVRHDDEAPCRKKGGDSCTYHVTWG